MVVITIIRWGYKPTYNYCRGHHIVRLGVSEIAAHVSRTFRAVNCDYFPRCFAYNPSLRRGLGKMVVHDQNQFIAIVECKTIVFPKTY